MTERWIGSLIEADCSALGRYCGILCRINDTDQSLVLSKASRDGKKCVFGEVTLGADDIRDLKIIKENATEQEADAHARLLAPLTPVSKQNGHESHNGTVTSSKKKPQNTPVSRKHSKRENVAYNGQQQYASPRQRANTLPTNGATMSNGGLPSRNRDNSGGKGGYANAKNEACFGEECMNDVDNEFDFESNLKLFDKKRVFSEIDALLEAKDKTTIRLVECNRRTEPKYRNDENILPTTETAKDRRQPSPTSQQYVTEDNSTVVSSVSRQTRDALLLKAAQVGLDAGRQRELLGRAAAEMVVDQLNASYGRTASSPYTIIILCSPSKSGSHWTASEAGLCAARHLTNHGARCIIMLSNDIKSASESFIAELELCRLSGAIVVQEESSLPKKPDALISCTIHPYLSHCSAPILLLDPSFVAAVQNVRWILYALRPLSASNSISNPTAVFLCDLGIPRGVFELCNVDFLPKLFQSKSIVRVRPFKASS